MRAVRCALIIGVAVGGLLGSLPAATANPCVDADSTPVTIRHVHDGDTVIRNDGERIRLIGLDTPELARDERPAEAGATVARDQLRRILQTSREVRLRPGRERRDHYGRLLAHLYADGRNVQAELLRAGLATPLFIAPNLEHADCYAQASRQARVAERGLWARADYQPQPAAMLASDGYRVITGTVQRVGRSRCCIWLNLENDVALRIEHGDTERFAIADWQDLEGRTLQARGRVYTRNGQRRLTLRHPHDWTLD